MIREERLTGVRVRTCIVTSTLIRELDNNNIREEKRRQGEKRRADRRIRENMCIVTSPLREVIRAITSATAAVASLSLSLCGSRRWRLTRTMSFTGIVESRKN